jgi:periplasmic divalent cation tolerance protein
LETVLVYVTCADREEARRIGQELVRARLAACVNVFSDVESFFHWEGKLEQAAETVMVAKTTRGRVPEVVAAIRARHSYSVPAILVLPVIDGNPAFISWVVDEVGGCDR